jgi:hypothetical protein
MTSNRIADRPPIAVKSLELGFASFIAVVNPTRMLAMIPKYPIIVGTTSEVTNTIENANVPIDQQTIATLNLVSFVLKMFLAELIRESFSLLLLEYCFAMLRSL